jgi:hypothetical protein
LPEGWVSAATEKHVDQPVIYSWNLFGGRFPSVRDALVAALVGGS